MIPPLDKSWRREESVDASDQSVRVPHKPGIYTVVFLNRMLAAIGWCHSGRMGRYTGDIDALLVFVSIYTYLLGSLQITHPQGRSVLRYPHHICRPDISITTAGKQ